ncbi:toxin-antitoxin system YwqK family antitoxin [Reichenbachiella sp.]|uniref:toxin-antitoxin system YwqK family antitoxin n=1 Tax=Reichenbachiella sp. TaxID=2184521 RepID=UPI003BAE73C8
MLRLLIIFFPLLPLVFLGCKDSKEVKYYKNGNIKFEVPIKNGKRNGQFIEYDSSGNVISIINVVNDIMEGGFRQFHSNGQVKYSGTLIGGRRYGTCLEYYDNGNLYRKLYFVQDTAVYGKTYSQEGHLIASNLPIKTTYDSATHSVEIELTHTEFDDASIFLGIGNIDSIGNLIDTLGYVNADSLKYVYKLDSSQTKLSGVLYEVKNPEGTFEARYHFKFEKAE